MTSTEPASQTIEAPGLAAFLTDRMYGDHRDRERLRFALSVPAEHHEAALAAWDRTLQADLWHLALAINALVFTIWLTPPFSWVMGRALRQCAARYSSHPDYRDEWRP